MKKSDQLSLFSQSEVQRHIPHNSKYQLNFIYNKVKFRRNDASSLVVQHAPCSCAPFCCRARARRNLHLP